VTALVPHPHPGAGLVAPSALAPAVYHR